MPLQLSSPITALPRVGPAKAKFLHKLGIKHVRDLLYTFPRRYDDFSRITPINELKVGERCAIRGQIVSAKDMWGFRGRRRLLRVVTEISDGTGTLHVTWYNLRFLSKQLWPEREIFVAGEVEPDPQNRPNHFMMRSPAFEFITNGGEQTHTAEITPVYPETFGVTSRWLRYQVKNHLPLLQAIPEYLPEGIRERHKLMEIHQALRAVHFPTSPAELSEAQRRLRFDELFFLQLAALTRRQRIKQKAAIPIKASKKHLDALIKELPFMLTKAQRTAIGEITNELARAVPMNRLLQGDVGSGKSAVALIATRLVLQQGYKALYLAPTEILARQQAEVFRQQLGPDQVALLIGALTAREKAQIKQKLTVSEPVCIVGTHALLQEDVSAHGVVLAIVDEQHRFGVSQRQRLLQTEQGAVPHLLSMTATPIPRTLNLTVYGDLDVSVLDELPPGRQPVHTAVVAPKEREEVIIKILEELHRGRQAYVIAPLVERSARLEVKSATETFEEMQKLFPGIAIGLAHGQLKSDEKEQVMRHFSAGAIQLLVATSVVEVGVNVPNATMMVIEGAERFGLAQLHQLRGRVGRGEHQSYCYLFPTTETAARSQRLRIMTKTTDGFVIAEEDLKLRGPGEVYGLEQSGFGDLKVASLLDYATIKHARTEAEKLLAADPDLAHYPILHRKVEQKNAQIHFE
jgi:ATP-dependent DNA helicase RecG